ncbi:MAG: hypothetical protein NUV85_04025 [Candidatus Berkelbacteria bacterium]|nr:hypothetical protein [Candidatus Berkelbacteria bacterium]
MIIIIKLNSSKYGKGVHVFVYRPRSSNPSRKNIERAARRYLRRDPDRIPGVIAEHVATYSADKGTTWKSLSH